MVVRVSVTDAESDCVDVRVSVIDGDPVDVAESVIDGVLVGGGVGVGVVVAEDVTVAVPDDVKVLVGEVV